MLHSGKQPERRMPYVCAYPRQGTYFLLLIYTWYAVFTKEKAQHGTAQQHRKTIENETKQVGKKKNLRLLLRNKLLPEWNILHRPKKKKKNSKAFLSASYTARLSRDHLTTDLVRVKLSSLSATVIPPRLKPGAHRGPRSPAQQSRCSACVALSVNFSLVAKISTA